MKLRSDPVVDDPMSDSNKENISLSKSSSGQGMSVSALAVESESSSQGASSRANLTSSSASSGTTLATFISTSDSLFKEPPALVINSNCTN